MGITNDVWCLHAVPPTSGVLIAQTKGWWNAIVGGAPDEMQPSGNYFFLWPNDARDYLQTGSAEYVPDATIRINDGETVIYLYRLED